MKNNTSKLKYIDPLIDFAFKKIFGSEPNKDLLIAFLNEVLRGKKHITDLVYNQTEFPGELATEGSVIFDLLCTGDQGEQFMIEVQRGKQENFKQRAIFYASRLISDQAPKGKRRQWNYELKEVYMIALLDGFILKDSPADKFIQDIDLRYEGCNKIFYDKLSFTFIELLKFDKKEDELETDLDKWLYVLKNMSQMNKLPGYLRKPVFEKLFNIAEYSNFTKEEKKMFDRLEKMRWDNKNVRDYELKTGIEAAIQEERRATAIKLKKLNMPLQEIAAITKLSTEALAKL